MFIAVMKAQVLMVPSSKGIHNKLQKLEDAPVRQMLTAAAPCHDYLVYNGYNCYRVYHGYHGFHGNHVDPPLWNWIGNLVLKLVCFLQHFDLSAPSGRILHLKKKWSVLMGK